MNETADGRALLVLQALAGCPTATMTDDVRTLPPGLLPPPLPLRAATTPSTRAAAGHRLLRRPEQDPRAGRGQGRPLGGLMDGIVEVLDANARRIEQAKLRAIGMRNRVITERENRDQKRRALQAVVAEKEADLARLEAQVKSLRQVEAEQQNVIDKLAVGEAYGRVPVEGTEEGF